MTSKTTLNDFQQATEAISLLLKKNVHKDLTEIPQWQKIGLKANLSHLRTHLDLTTQMIREVPLESFDFEQFVSIATRSLFLLQHAILNHPKAFEDWKENARLPQNP